MSSLRRFVYVLKNSDDPPRYYYTGLTSDIAKRLREHNEGTSTNTTASGRPWHVDTIIEFPALNAVIIPPNVPHFMTNTSGARARLLEYQPVARRDWLSVTAKVPAPTAPQAVLGDAPMLAVDFSLGSSGWTVADNGARVKTVTGKTIRIRMLDLSARTASVEITFGQPRVQRFVYVFQGHATIAAGSTTRRIDPEIYVEVTPAGDNIVLSSTSGDSTIVAVFEPVPR